jgi:hypothetical protein
MVFCGDCSNPTRIEGRYRKCDTCRTSTKLKRIKPKSRKQLGAEKLRAQMLHEDSVRQSQEMLDAMQVDQWGDSAPR